MEILQAKNPLFIAFLIYHILLIFGDNYYFASKVFISNFTKS